MIRPWAITLCLRPPEAHLRVKSLELGELLRARLPAHPQHPRALLTLLEGLALWAGGSLAVAFDADDRSPHGSFSALLGDELWPAESPLVRFEVVHQGRHARPLRSLRKPGNPGAS